MAERITNAVQPAAWFKALPRPGYASLDLIDQSQDWFKVYRLPHDVCAIYEPGHFQEVISYLVPGSERALLIDTGMGIGDMRKLVGELSVLPTTVINTHCHFDHIGCNWQFERVHIFDHPAAINRLRTGMPRTEVVHHLADDSTWIPYPEGFDPAEYSIRPSSPEPIADGHRFELGDRTLEAIHAPGHSPDSIMLFDADANILFTGDTLYPATLYAHLATREGITSEFDTYRRTMRGLAERFAPEWLYTSHNEPMVRGETLGRVARAFEEIASGALDYAIDEDGLRKYQFDGFAIVTADPPEAISDPGDLPPG